MGEYVGESRGDQFGTGLAVKDDFIVVGSPARRNSRGAAYIISKSGAFPDIALQASDESSSGAQQFGYSLDISGDRIIVGAHVGNGAGQSRGAIYVFDTSGNEIQKTVPPNGGDDGGNFGERVTASTQNFFVSSFRQDSNQGAVHVLDLSGAYVFSLLGEVPGDNFGFHVHIAGNLLVVGAYAALNGNGVATGVAYIFTLTGSPVTGATLVTKIEADDGQDGDQFGSDVSAISDTVYVSAPFNTNANGSQAGAIYIFSTTGVQLEKKLAPGGAAGDKFGLCVSASDTDFVVGAPERTVATLTAAGAAFLFH